MKIWVDLGNSPQVLFFRPLIALLEKSGHNIKITTRDYAQTISLADEYKLEHTSIGKHGGKDWSQILITNSKRVIDLVRWAYRNGSFDLAVSHNSYTQGLAAKLLGIPFVTLMDYEHQKLNHLCFRLAQKVIVPRPFPDELLLKFGAKNKTRKYNGLKEQMYLCDFDPEPDYLDRFNISKSKIIVVMRPPAPWATYHRCNNNLFELSLDYLGRQDSVQIILLPRVELQGEIAKKLNYPNIYIPKDIVDGPNLIYAADLVISGGGTMNREAAILGTPAYTLFKGALGSVDQHLIDKGKLIQIIEAGDIRKIELKKLKGPKIMDVNGDLVDEIIGFILH